MGGLGLRSAVDHAAVAHAVSLLSAQSLLDGLLGEEEEGPHLPQPVLDQISAKTGEEASVESLTGVPQKKASLNLSNQSFLLQHFTEEGEERDIARMASWDCLMPEAGSLLYLLLRWAFTSVHMSSCQF